ncbi:MULTISPECIES: hypothetical protein [unclassified Rhizobium]|uniref:hypothetical protein n=1 Tax=unclassified Rhizobium TaxID=2613769 RepID=UPI001602EF5F|nr:MULTISPECIES: hypothetical protein [unclassified Rhizobium]MBB1250008.1 hypothetical protein [Rhizobium sp. G21]MCV3765951.1 hypothetical protein [Rhizobium sp. TRM95796]
MGTSPRPNLIDPVPLREMLRGIRFMVKRGGEALKSRATTERLPKPAADFANAVLDEMMGLGHKVNAQMSVLAKSMIGTEPDSDILLADLAAQEQPATLFAATIYPALKLAAARMCLSGVFVSEAAARKAFLATVDASRHLSGADVAAALTFALIDAQVLQGPVISGDPSLSGHEATTVTIFAVLLWLQSPRDEADQEMALMSAIDLSQVFARQIVTACAARDAGALSALYAKYADNV